MNDHKASCAVFINNKNATGEMVIGIQTNCLLLHVKNLRIKNG